MDLKGRKFIGNKTQEFVTFDHCSFSEVSGKGADKDGFAQHCHFSDTDFSQPTAPLLTSAWRLYLSNSWHLLGIQFRWMYQPHNNMELITRGHFRTNFMRIVTPVTPALCLSS